MTAKRMGTNPSPSTLKVHQVAMVGGEIAPSLWYRYELEKVKISLATCQNFIPQPHGSTTFRPGTWKIAETKNSGQAILIAMSFSNEPSIHIEIGNLYMHFYVDGQQVMNGSVPYEISSPYELADLDNIRYVQSADTLFIVDGNHKPRTLKRYSNDNWSLDVYEFINGPFLKDNSTNTTLTLSSVNGSSGQINESVDITASTAMFTSADVGRWVKIRYTQDASEISSGDVDPNASGVIGGPWSVDGSWTITGSFSASTSLQVRIVIQYSIDGGTTYQDYDAFLNMNSTNRVTIEGELRAEDYNGIIPKIRLYADGNTDPFSWVMRYKREFKTGLLKITSITSSTVVRCQVKQKCTFLDIPTKQWALGAWTDLEGWPSIVNFHQDRLTFARTKTSPFDIWQSVTGDYSNFAINSPVQDDDSIRIPIRSRYLDNINGLVSLKDLIVLTSGGEWRITGSAEGNAITPDSMYVSNQGYRGSYDMEPIVAGSSVLFVQRFGTRVRDLAYSFESDGYDSTDLSIFATHLFDGYSIIDWCWQQEPWNVLWVVRSDGVLLGLSYMKEQDVWAWHKHNISGQVESISCAPGLYEDEVYMLVKRNINGTDRRFVEKLSIKSEQLHLDSAVVAHDGAPVTTVSGLDHLEGEHVVIVADGVPVYGHIVSEGSVTLDKAASYIVVGLGYTGTIQTLPMLYETKDGMSTGSRRRATEIILQLSESRRGFVGTSEDDMYPIHYEQNEAYTGIVNELLSSEYDYAAQVTIEQRDPLPFTILTWTVKIAHGD